MRETSMKKQIKFVAVLSTAALLSLYGAAASFGAEGWAQENGSWVYYDRAGERVTEDWIQDNERWFWLDENGEMASDGLRQIRDEYYYFRGDGSMVSGEWVSVPNEYAGMEDEPENYWYYFQENGKAMRRPSGASSGSLKAKTIDGKKYAFDTEGRMLYGWVAEGERQTGEDAWENSDYYFGDENDGAMKQGWMRLRIQAEDVEDDQPGAGFWEEEQDRWFYFNANGKKIRGKENDCKYQTINGNKYGFDEYGRMIATWYADPEILTLATSRSEAGEGRLYQGQEEYSRQFMYFGTPEAGARYANGWFKARPSEYLMKSKYDDGEMYNYYADGDGNICVNEIKTIDGEKYAFDNAGRQLNGMVCVKMDEGSSNQFEYSFYSDASVRAGRGPYSDEAEFHDLMETYAEDFASHSMRLYLFNGPSGSMLTGKQKVQLGKSGEFYEFMFETGGRFKGAGVCGEKDGRLYQAGMLLKPEEGEKYAIFKETFETLPEDATEEERTDFENRDTDGDGKIEGALVKVPVEEFISEVCNSGIYDEKEEETVWTVRYDPPGVTYYLVGQNGDIVKNKKSAADVDGYEFYVKNKKICSITVEE